MLANVHSPAGSTMARRPSWAATRSGSGRVIGWAMSTMQASERQPARWLRATERQRVSDQQRHAWPGNAMTVTVAVERNAGHERVHERRATGGEPRRLLQRLGGTQQGHVGALAGHELHADGQAVDVEPGRQRQRRATRHGDPPAGPPSSRCSWTACTPATSVGYSTSTGNGETWVTGQASRS